MTDGIVLHSLPYGEDYLIVDLLTREEGYLSVIHRMSRSRRGVRSRTMFYPLSFVSVEVDGRGNGRLRRLKRCVHRPLLSIPYEVDKMSVAMFLSEFLRVVLRHEPFNASIYDYIEHSLVWYDLREEGYANFHLLFLLRLSRLLGFAPNLSNHARGHCFDLLSGRYRAVVPSHGHYVCAEEAYVLPLLFRLPMNHLHLLKMNRGQRQRLLALVIEYYRLHVENFQDLSSLAVLESLYD